MGCLHDSDFLLNDWLTHTEERAELASHCDIVITIASCFFFSKFSIFLFFYFQEVSFGELIKFSNKHWQQYWVILQNSDLYLCGQLNSHISDDTNEVVWIFIILKVSFPENLKNYG